jgi:PAS domain S-box-containing protein
VAEAGALGGLTLALGWDPFFTPHDAGRAHSHEYLLAPLAVWAALRFGLPGASALAAVLAGFALAGGARGLGEFSGSVSGKGPLAAALFIGTLSATSLVLAVVTGQLRKARRRAERGAEAAGELLEEARQFMRHAPLPVFVRDASGRFLAASRAYGEMAGRAPRDVAGRTLAEVWGPEFGAEIAREDEQALATGEVVRGCLEHRGRSFLTIKFRLGSGERTRVGGYVVDVTERKHAERALRLASVGALASGVAHEVNNPLSFLSSNLAYVFEELGELEREIGAGRIGDLRAALGEALHGADRVRRIVRDLRQISTRRRVAAHPLDPRAALETALELVRGRIRAHGELEERLLPVPSVMGSEAELSEAFVNVLVNAIEAITPGSPDRHRVRVESGTDGEGRAFVVVSDTGRGIPADELPRIFDAFYTTKEPGAGTGLGLAVAHGIVSRMGGAIHVDSTEGTGTSVRVVLPASPEAPAARAPSPRRRRAEPEGRA